MIEKQSNNVLPELIFWFDAPPRAGAGVFRTVAQNWGNKVYYMCRESMSEERRSGGWMDCDHGKAVMIYLNKKENPDLFVSAFVNEHREAIQVCNGFRSRTASYIKKHLFPMPNAKIALWSERPGGGYGSRIKNFVRKCGVPFLYRYYALRYSRIIKALLPLGSIGVETFARLGWDREILFPFMYDPSVPSGIQINRTRFPGEPLRFLYLGRFARNTKGVDVLIQAINGLSSGDNWHLDMVGGYGDLKDFTIAWAERHPNVSFAGTWPSNEVCQRITPYDTVIVPSRFDGWNVVTNEAISAGVGVIITDAAASDDLVRASGAGVVVPAGDVKALRKTIQSIIDDPAIIDTWKEKARLYSPRISSESVGRYLIDVLIYTFLDPPRPRPECPWL